MADEPDLSTGGRISPANLVDDSVPVLLSEGDWYAPGIPDDLARDLNR